MVASAEFAPVDVVETNEEFVHSSARADAFFGERLASTRVEPRERRAPARETKSVRFVRARERGGGHETNASTARTRTRDALVRADLAKTCVNCLRCGKVYDLRARDGATSSLALEFLERRARCCFCETFVKVTLADGSTFDGGEDDDDAQAGGDGASAGETSVGSGARAGAEEEDAAVAAAVAAKDRLVRFDQTSATRTTVIDDQSEYYEIDGNAWLDENEREELKRQAREMREAEDDARRRARTTWTIDLVGRRVAAPMSSGFTGEYGDERADADALAAAKAIRAALATNDELARGGGGASASALETARELESRRVFVNPSVVQTPTFLRAAARDTSEKTLISVPLALTQRADTTRRRVLDDDPFERVALEAAELGFL